MRKNRRRDTFGRPETAKVADLVGYEGNAKEHPSENVDAIAASIERLGFGAPLVCWHDDAGRPTVVAGHGRLLAAKKLGMSEVPVVFRDDWTDAERRAYTLADNQTTMMTGWDEDTLAYELDALQGLEGLDMTVFGFDLAALGEGEDADVVEDEPPAPEDVETRVSQGEVWALGVHRLMCGDATSAEDVERLGGGGAAR